MKVKNFIIWSSIILLPISIVIPTIINTVTKKIDSININELKLSKDEIRKNITERQILLKVTLYTNNSEVDEIFFNSYFISSNKIMVPLRTIQYISDNINANLPFELSFTTFDENNKNINDQSIWTKFNIKNVIQVINNVPLKTKNNFIFVEIDHYKKISDYALSFNYIVRKNILYRYIYSSMYIKSDMVISVFNEVTVNHKLNENVDLEYEIDGNIVCSNLSNIFEVNSQFGMREIGSINSLVIDPSGFIMGFQADQNLINDVIFYGVKYE